MPFIAGWRETVVRVIAGLLVSAVAFNGLAAQVPANERWRTIETPHFRVHFTDPLEAEARHAASVAERAYANLATELVTPRGPVDIVVSDGTDASNGSATVIPRPRVIIFARPPVDDPSLESYNDWTVLVLQHELTHIFHLDRSRGWWRAAQAVFGRNPVLFPNYYTPSWLTEGLAVYYESRFTSGGRLHGSFESAVVRAAAVDHLAPSLSELSLATSRFPYGESVYVYGSFVWDDIAREHGASAIPAFIERSSEETIPFFLDREAKRSFGETFTHSWNEWRDSVLRSVNDSAALRMQSGPAPAAFASSRAIVIPNGGRDIVEPRWIGDSALVFAANNGRETPGLYRARLNEAPVRQARRNSLDVNDPSHNGLTVFSQDDYIDRYHVRGDLYAIRGGVETRLTHGKRLSAPSVRADGEMVAVQTVPGTTRLVRVSGDGRHITPITTASLDTQWAAPRWSPDGSRIVAVRIAGAPNEIVVLDSTGRVIHEPVRQSAVLRSPAWVDNGRSILFTSDSSGASQLSVVPADGEFASVTPVRLTAEPGGVYGVDAVNAGADSVRIATTALRGDGYHVLVWTVSNAELASLSARGDSAPLRVPDVTPSADPRWRVTDDTSRSRSYSPWRTLAPAYWSPTFAQVGDGRGALIGALTGASDVIGRHSYVAQASVNTHNSNVDASLDYAYNRWANPGLALSLEQSWTYANITGGGQKVGDLGERSRFVNVHATFSRPRVRTYSAITVGAELESDQYSSSPGDLLAKLDSFFSTTHNYPSLVAGVVFSSTQSPTLSISPEDGVTFAGSVRQRWESSTGVAGRSAVAIGAAYKSLDLPGFAHHVIAIRAAIGAADHRSPSVYSAGGVSGESFEIVPGITFGSSTRTFPARGFPAGSETGIDASSVSAEYRLPLIAPSRSLGLFPFFLDRASLALFGDAARASCPSGATPACSPSSNDGPTLGSVGAELNLDSALQFDVPYRFRFGLAHPVHGAAYAGASSVSLYATLGLAF
ncbi:MAG TPA: hypothetical protein VLI40_08340 [Gemmatimonadaceae bacterium]|nr:hypothetical protein [Gemmatimonadaceae bacterium]